VIQKKDIEGKILIQDKSMMPEGLANNMTVQDFRDLIRYLMAHPFITDVALAAATAEGSLELAHPLASPGVKWSRLRVGAPGRIFLPEAKNRTTTHVAAAISAPSSLRTRLQLGAANPVKVWLNGKLVYEGQPGPSPVQPDQAGADVILTEGINHLLVQVNYQGGNAAIYARFLDPDRKIRYGEEKGQR
jgi:hypothetical protein